jgi:membrane fusion protein (multidrug efflux system)
MKFSLVLWSLCAAGLAGCGAKADQKKAAAPPPPLVQVVQVEPTDTPIFAEYSAQTFARDLVDVRGRVDGFIQKRLFNVGADVSEGQVLYVLDLRPYEADVAKAKGEVAQAEANLEFARNQVALVQAQADLAQAEANLSKANQDVARLEPLAREEAAPKQDLDNAVSAQKANEANVAARRANVQQQRLSTTAQIATAAAQLDSNLASLRTAELNLEYATIHAPIAGKIGDSLIPVGGLVSKTSPTPLTTIVPLDPIWVRFKVSESEYLTYENRADRPPQSSFALEMLLADGTRHPYIGRIQNATNQVDSKTGTLELQATFPNPKHDILPGQFGRVRFQTDQRKAALVVPQRAMQELQGLQSVFVVSPDNKVLARSVIPGDRVGDGWIITQGLEPGDRVIVEGTLKIRPGMQVNPQPYKPQTVGK